jgi:hypothetical protein
MFRIFQPVRGMGLDELKNLPVSESTGQDIARFIDMKISLKTGEFEA